MNVLDASALLAYFMGEPCADVVERHLDNSFVCAANWSEVLSKITSPTERNLAEAILQAHEVEIEPVLKADAVVAANLNAQNPTLSLGDRFCIALGVRLDVPVVTVDRAWGNSERIIQIR